MDPPGGSTQPFATSVLGKAQAEPEEGGQLRWGHFGVSYLRGGNTHVQLHKDPQPWLEHG